MGLDMYLYREQYVSGWNFDGKSDTSLYDTILEATGLQRCEGSPHATLRVCVAYWRKANEVHNWFVSELAGGVDECQPIYVDREKLVELRDLCAAVILEPAMAPKVLPTKAGFFFGSYEYDEWYMEDMKLTVQQLDAILAACPADTYPTFIYQASW